MISLIKPSAQKGRDQQLDFCNWVCAINRQNYAPCQYAIPSLNISPMVHASQKINVKLTFQTDYYLFFLGYPVRNQFLPLSFKTQFLSKLFAFILIDNAFKGTRSRDELKALKIISVLFSVKAPMVYKFVCIFNVSKSTF